MNYNDNPLYDLVKPLIERMELEKAKAILWEHLGTKDYRCTYALKYLAVIAQLENDYQASYDILMEILSYNANNIMAIESLKKLNYLLTSSSPIQKISSPANLLFVGDTLFCIASRGKGIS